MAQPVIAYDKVLPEIPDRCSWERPDSHLVKDKKAPMGWRVHEGRRPSRMLMVPKIRKEVDEWRRGSIYPGATDVTRRLFEYWFEEEHEVPGLPFPFRYYFCQREAIETLAWLVEVAGKRDTVDLIKRFARIHQKDLFFQNISFQTTQDGRRRIRRFVPEREAEGVQDLPPEDLRRYAFKMATGSGKTWVMAMVIVWSYFQKKWVADSEMASNFLIIAPNVIVYQRLEKDFASNRIFHEIPLVPPEWLGAFSQKVILRGEATEPDPSGNLFLTNIQQLYESREQEWTPLNAVEALLGKKPAVDLAASGQRSMLERVKGLKNLVVLNDEAHHVHDEGLAWSQSILAVHRALPEGLSLWLDFSATPKDQNGMYYPWTVCDYPLAQAVEDRIVKAPLIVTCDTDPKKPAQDPDRVTADTVGEKYDYWLKSAVSRWKEHWQVYHKLQTRPVLFIMTEKNVYADALGEYLVKTREFGFKQKEVLVIHTDAAGEITKKDLEMARQAARDIDRADSPIKAIVSVMMLREGWDVRNVSVVLGLRPFTAKAEILPEQVIGRGLRLMTGIGPDRTQTLEVLGTRNLLDVLRNQLEAEGIGVGLPADPPTPPVIVEPIKERMAFDIAIPITKPRLVHDIRKLSDLSIEDLQAIYDQDELGETFRINLKLEFAHTQTEVHQTQVEAGEILSTHLLLSSITSKLIDKARLPARFAELVPLVRRYIEERCFGRRIDVEDPQIRSHLSKIELQEGIAAYLARRIGELLVERREIEFDKEDFHLSDTLPFSWRRNLPPLVAGKTVFNFVATYNDFERRFAQFLEQAPDVRRFSSLGTTEQGESGTRFRVDYLKPNGAIGFYHPDWVVVRAKGRAEINWIIETKGRVWEGTAAKDEAIQDWCERIGRRTGSVWRYQRVNQKEFEALRPKSLSELTAALDGAMGLL